MRRISAFLFIFLSAACGDANVEGNYSIAVTNRDNGCNFQNWTVGQQASGIAVTINQEGSDVSATVEGATGALLNLTLGSNFYTGDVEGSSLLLELFGNRSQTMGNCAFTFNSIIDAEANGDALTGRIEYTAAGNGNPDCASIDGCVTFQDFNGTRPPS
jgi:hypothetical protein